jgi:hypothetical protein
MALVTSATQEPNEPIPQRQSARVLHQMCIFAEARIELAREREPPREGELLLHVSFPTLPGKSGGLHGGVRALSAAVAYVDRSAIWPL